MKSGLILLVLGAAMSAPGHAGSGDTEAQGSHRLTLQGFGTLGIARSDNDDAQYVRDLSQPFGVTSKWSAKIDSLLGIQAGYRFDGQLDGVMQAVTRYRYDGGWQPEITWAFLRYDPHPALSLRMGRLGTEFYMQADSRLIGYSNLTVRPPPDYFGPLVFSYFDGIDATLARPLGEGLVRGKLFAGRSPETTPFMDGFDWRLDGSRLLGGHLDYEDGPWQFRLSHARVRFENESPLDAAFPYPGGLLAAFPELAIAGTWTRFSALGMVYDRGPLQLQLMLSRTDHETAAYEDTRSGYAIVSYRIGEVRPFLGYSRTTSEPVPPAKDPYGIAAGTHSDQHTWFLGARWDVREKLALKAQVDWLRGTPDSIFPFRYKATAPMPPWDGRMTVFSLALDFVF